MLIWGPLSDKYGRKAPTAIGFIIFCVASLLCMMAVNIYVLLALAPFPNKAIALGSMVAICLALTALGWWSLNRSGNEIKGLYR